MPLNHRSLLLSAGLLSSLVAAFYAGRWSVGSGATAGNGNISSAAEGMARADTAGAPLKADGRGGRSDGAVPAAGAPAASTTGAPPVADGPRLLSELRSAMREKNPTLKMQQFLAILSQLTSAEMPEAMKFLNDLPEDTGREMSMALGQWAQSNPLAALTWLDTQNDRLKGWASQEIMQTWAEKDALGAIAWAQEKGSALPQGKANPWLVGVINGIASNQPGLAANLTASLPYSRERGVALEAVVSAFFRSNKDGSAARQWVEGLPESDPKFKQGAVGRVAGEWAETAPEKAAAWVEALPEGMRGRALASVVGTWADTDPNAAGTWLGKFPAGAERNEAVVNFAYTVRDQDPEASMIWAGTITDDRQRDDVTVRLARDWMQRDATAARNWIQNAKVSESTREQMLRSNRG